VPIVYDTIIRQGIVVDPETKTALVRDVGIRNGKIVEISENLDPNQALEVIDANELYVTPGLVDLHTHIFWGSTFWGINPDPIAAITGVTVIDLILNMVFIKIKDKFYKKLIFLTYADMGGCW